MTATNDRISIPDRSRPDKRPRSPSNTRAGMRSVLLVPNSVSEKTLPLLHGMLVGKVEELLHEMDRYTWSILGLYEMRWKTSGEIPADEGHRV